MVTSQSFHWLCCAPVLYWKRSHPIFTPRSSTACVTWLPLLLNTEFLRRLVETTRLNEEQTSIATTLSSFLKNKANELLYDELCIDCFYYDWEGAWIFYLVAQLYCSSFFNILIGNFTFSKYGVSINLLVNNCQRENDHFDVHFRWIRYIHNLSIVGKDAYFEGRYWKEMFICCQNRQFLFHLQSWKNFPFYCSDVARKQLFFPPGKKYKEEKWNCKKTQFFWRHLPVIVFPKT